MIVDEDLYGHEVIADPYPYYAQLRQHDPVHWNARYETWVVTRYDDVAWILRHPEIFSSRFYVDDPRPPSPPIDEADLGELRYVAQFRKDEIIQNDPPEHTRLRRGVGKFFSPASMETWRPIVQAVVGSLLDDLRGKESFDVCTDIARHLPLLVISEMMGFPNDDRPALKEQADRRMMSALSLEPDRMRVAASGIRDTCTYLDQELDRRARQLATSPRPRTDGDAPGSQDLLELILAAEAAGAYSRAEVLANIPGFFDAGHETTIQLICNGVLAFLRHPHQWERFCADPLVLLELATEECLRYDPPLPAPRRVAAQDVELRGKTIRRGDRVLFVIAAANRDPEVFDNPDTFDIEREFRRNLAFGFGVHTCLGQYLARMEGQEVFLALAQRSSALALADGGQIEYARVRGVRSVLSLPVTGVVR